MSPARQWCEQLYNFRRDSPIPTPAALVLKYGAEWERRRVWRWHGQQKACYANAQYLARTRKGLRYAEGFATGVVPVEHAWCVDEKGRVVDPTWDEERTIGLDAGAKPDYFGIAFDRETVRRIRKITGNSYSLLFTWWKWPEVYEALAKEGLG